MDNRIYLECINSKSKKFYELTLDKTFVYIKCGRINKKAKNFSKSFKDEIAAAKFFQKQTIKKLKKGYKKSTQKIEQLTFFSEFEIQSFLYTEEEYIRSGKLPY